MDDETKDSTLLLANLLPSVLAALPIDHRLRCMNEMFGDLGIEVRLSATPVPAAFDASRHLKDVMKECAEAQMTILNVNLDASLAANEEALREVVEARESLERAEAGLRANIAMLRTKTSDATH